MKDNTIIKDAEIICHPYLFDVNIYLLLFN